MVKVERVVRMSGAQLKMYRHHLNLTQCELAERLNLSVKTVSRYENEAAIPIVVEYAVRYLHSEISYGFRGWTGSIMRT